MPTKKKHCKPHEHAIHRPTHLVQMWLITPGRRSALDEWKYVCPDDIIWLALTQMFSWCWYREVFPLRVNVKSGVGPENRARGFCGYFGCFFLCPKPFSVISTSGPFCPADNAFLDHNCWNLPTLPHTLIITHKACECYFLYPSTRLRADLDSVHIYVLNIFNIAQYIKCILIYTYTEQFQQNYPLYDNQNQNELYSPSLHKHTVI